MLEMLVLTTFDRGAPVVAKLTGAPWGANELKEFARVEWENSEIEARLNDLSEAGEPYPMEYVYSQESGLRFNLDALSSEMLSAIDDPQVESPLITLELAQSIAYEV